MKEVAVDGADEKEIWGRPTIGCGGRRIGCVETAGVAAALNLV